MKQPKIKLNNEIDIDLSVLMETKLAVLANSGGGKSWAIRRIVEQAFGQVQIIIIDPESEYGNLRKEFDFVLAGEGGEVVTKTHIAGKLAERLMKLKASAIVDLYELLPQERKRFVKLFLDSLMNLPKDMQTPVLLVIDEAHVFAPEGKPSEASTSMEALASQGRKRNIGLILATQRISKMSKDVLAECNNKMIGRMSLDIDRKRASDELGFYGKEQILSLRNLKPGEFYLFGSAISDGVIVGKVGDVKILPPKRGVIVKGPTPPTAGVRKLIAQLADLPQEAHKEAQTVAELKKENTELKQKNTRLENASKQVVSSGFDQKFVEKAVKTAQNKQIIDFTKQVNPIKKIIDHIFNLSKDAQNLSSKIIFNTNEIPIKQVFKAEQKPVEQPRVIEIPKNFFTEIPGLDNITPGEKKVLNAIAQYPEGVSKAHLYVLTGYRSTSLVVYSQKLLQRGFAERTAEGLRVTQSGIDVLGSDFQPLPEGIELREHLLKTLPEGERRVFEAVINGEFEPGTSTKHGLMESTGYKSTSITVYVQKLTARKAVVNDHGIVRLSDKLQ